MSADIQLPQPWQPIAGAPLDTPIRTAGFGAGDRLPHNYITTLRRGAETGAFAWCPVSFDPPPPFDNYATWREWERQQARTPGGPPMTDNSRHHETRTLGGEQVCDWDGKPWPCPDAPMTDNDPAVEKRYVVLDQRGDVYGVPCDQTIAKSRLAHWNNDPETGVHLTAYRLVPCDADGNPTPEGARALFPELAGAVDAWTEHVTDSEHLNVGRVAMTAARVFTLPDQPDQENPELDSGSRP